MDLIEYAAVLRRRWLAIVVLMLLGGAIGLGYGKSSAPTYQATSKVFVSVENGSSVSDLVQGSTFTQNLVQSYSQLATTPAVLDPVISELGLDTTATKLARRVTAETPLDTVIIEISASSSNARESAAIANAVARQLPATVKSVSPSSRKDTTPVSIRTIADATVPTVPVAPNTKFLTATGLAAGLLLGIVLAVLWKLLDTRLRDRHDVEQVTKVPLLGEIPRWRGTGSQQVAVRSNPRGARAEAYRRVRSNFEFVRSANKAGVLVVTSAQRAEGKSTTAVNFALAMAEQGKNVLLVDADLRRPSIASVTGTEGSVGLTTVLIGQASIDDVTQQWGMPTMHLLNAGALPPNPLQLLDSDAMFALIVELRRRYDVVIFDSPPLLPVSDAAVLAKHADGAIVTVTAGRTRRRQLQLALETLEVAAADVLGIIVTRAKSGRGATYYQRETSWWSRLQRRRTRPEARPAPATTPAAAPDPSPGRRAGDVVAPADVSTAEVRRSR